ncbi:MAG: serine hydrolase domain-containing protein [Vicinamibacterales bacterium]
MTADPRMRAGSVLDAAVAARAFPGAVAETGSTGGMLWEYATGHLTYEPEAPHATPRTTYDLASLTKVIAATSLAMRLVRRGALSLDAPASDWMPEWRTGPFARVRVQDLLEHASGLPAWLPLFQSHKGREEYRRAIAALAPEYPPRTKSIYSDLGFIVLGQIIEATAGATLDLLFDEFRMAAGLPDTLRYGVESTTNVAPTEFDPWRGRLCVGEVHDENAFALGGAAAHAGLFGMASDVGAFARLVLRTFREDTALGTPPLMQTFVRRSEVPESSRALGWDTMLPTSSCGAHMSPRAIGHTGFTGTSLWIDPARDRYFALLTNRVHPTRDNEAIQAVRRAWHDAAAS